MGDIVAFLKINRKEAGCRPILERINDFGEVEQTLSVEDRMMQASRCMDCGVPFCHWSCPLGNLIPEWQDLLYKNKWQEAYNLLNFTNNFPEFTGRICPSFCEKSCILNLENQPLTIRENEAAITEYAFSNGYVVPRLPLYHVGKKVAVIGSGPAGLTVASVLNQKGYSITVYEKDECIGGLLSLGIPDFKLNKEIVERRVSILKIEGIKFETNVEVGKDITIEKILFEYDAICLALGAVTPRDLLIDGRELVGIHFALDFLKQQNRIVGGKIINSSDRISANGKNVLIIGGGDTGSDCVGTSIRQKAKKVTQIEILSMPSENISIETYWPAYPNMLKTSSSHEEGCERRWSLKSKKFIGDGGRVVAVEVVEVEWLKDEFGSFIMKETNKKEIIPAELVLLSMGFIQPDSKKLLNNLVTMRNVKENMYKVFYAGDVVNGSSLVVHAINSGNEVAKSISDFLK
ncbi:MAG: glutamate synthase subunit beta [Bacteroidales bacterium OttesenSCG-928-I14]|jgi:glutamate synthase (NADPH/NADH) small chain|nr:glutamate synthase subunit beta [Bacteroidales bacterium OttesenSCG-928-I14]